MTDSRPLVSVVIPCCNERPSIENCLRSVLAQDTGDIRIEVIVADGMSSDGTREVLKRLAAQEQRLKVIDNPKRIVSAGLNIAIDAARGQIVIRMDAHTQYAPDYIRECVLTLKKTGADNVGGPWVARGDRYISQVIAAAFQSAFAVGGARGHNPHYEGLIDTVYLGCWRREVFDRIGFFDEELVRNQDDEFNLRLVRAGGRIWQSPRIRSWYRPRSSLRNLFLQYLQYGYWKVRVIQKHRLPASIRHVIPACFVAVLIGLIIAAPFSALAAYALAVVGSAYTVCILAATIATGMQFGFRLIPILPVVFASYHVGYGIGFIWGMCDFLLLRRVSRFATALTRSSESSATRQPKNLS